MNLRFLSIFSRLVLSVFFLVPFFSNSQINISSISTTKSTCPNNGTITIQATSSNPPILYSITSGPVTEPPQTNSTFNSLPPGTYTITVKDGNGKEEKGTATITGNYIHPSFTLQGTSPYCPGESSGELTVNMVNGTGLAPYTWKLIAPSPVTKTQSNPVFDSIPSGDYTVRTIDVCGSVSTKIISIVSPNTSMSLYGGLSAEKVGCDSMKIRYKLNINEIRFPLSYVYHTSNGDYIPTSSNPPFIDSAFIHGSGIITIEQIIPNMTYGDAVSVTITNSCGYTMTSSILNTYPFVFYPKYSFNACGSGVDVFFNLLPNNFSPNHTFLKEPLSYTFTNTNTGHVVDSGTISKKGPVATISIAGGVALSGETYRVSITDGCGQHFTQDYTIPTKTPPTAAGTILRNACIDSVVGVYRITTTGFDSGRGIVFLAGPASMGSTKPRYTYSDTYSWPSDTIFFSNNNNLFLANLAAGTYHYRVFDDCGHSLDKSFTITPQEVTSLHHKVSYEKGCPGKNKIYFSMASTGTVTVKDLSDGSIIRNVPLNQNWNNINKDSILNVPSGNYEITFDYETPSAGNYLNDHPLSCWQIVDTVIIPPYENPEVAAENIIICGNLSHIELLPDSTKGLPPYQYEISSGPEIFPLQSSNIFTVSTPGKYHVRIFDACGNASVKQVTVDTLSFEAIVFNSTCTSKKIGFLPSIYYTYEWIFPNHQKYTGDSLKINPVTASDTGIYKVSRITNFNGCIDTSTTQFYVEMPGHYKQSILFCGDTTIAVGSSIYTLPGIYYDTLTNSKGCDSILTTLLEEILPIYDTTTVNICAGDSIYIAGNYVLQPGFYTDTIPNSKGCFDFRITHLKIRPNVFYQTAKICYGETYSIGKNTFNTTGIHKDTLQSELGCDSIIVLDLEILSQITTNLTDTICEKEVYYFEGESLTTSGNYTDTLMSSTGCDSIVHLQLTVLPRKFHEIFDTICKGEEYIFNGISYDESGDYSATYPTSDCDSIVVLHLTVRPLPYIGIIVPPIIRNGEEVELGVSSNSKPLVYSWESGAKLSDSTIENPTLTIDSATWVQLTITDQYGCSSTLKKYIGIDDFSTLYVPNAVTPDGDQFNNFFQVYGTNIKQFHIVVFNRWGEVIFESDDFHFVWDCTYKGKIVPDGVYVYKLKAVGTDNVYYQKVGHITVLR